MRPNIRKLLIAVLALVLCVSAVMLIRQTLQYREGEAEYAEAEALVELPDLSQLEPAPAPEPEPEETEEPEEEKPVYIDPYAGALAAMDFTALREVNSDVLGWILIPGTVISYPLLQGDDNSYYLNHTWKKWTNVVGSIFLECQNSPGLSDFNTVVYGHRMNNGSMFASLKYYKQQSYWAQHPKVYITDDNGAHCYEIFAAYEISTAGDTYKLSFPTDQSKQAYIDYCLEKSVIDTGLTPTVYDRILTLSTCTGNGHATRWVVQALLRGEVPPAAQEQPEETAEVPAESAGEAAGPAQPSGETVPSGEAASDGESTAPETDPAAEAAESQAGSAGEVQPAETGQDAPQVSGQGPDGEAQSSVQSDQPGQSAQTAPE